MSVRSPEVRVRGSEKPPLAFESADLKADLRGRFFAESVNESSFALGTTGVETAASFEGKKEVASSILVFWEKFEAAIESINHLTENGAPNQNTEDLTQLKDQEFEVAQIATKILDSNQVFDTRTITDLQTKVMMAEAVVDSIIQRVLSAPVSMLSPVTNDVSTSVPGEQATNQIELLRPLGDQERKAYQFLFDKFDTQIVPEMSGLVSDLNESGTEYTTSYVETFNDLADRINDLEREVANSAPLASQSEYQAMGQELQGLVNRAQTQYFALLQEVENQSTESGSASTFETQGEVGAEIAAFNQILDQAEVQFRAIYSALDKAQAGSFSFTFSRKQKVLMDKVLDLLGGESNPNSIEYSLRHLQDATARGEKLEGNRVQLTNKLRTVQDNLGELGRVLSQFMSEDDRQLFAVTTDPLVTTAENTPAIGEVARTLPDLPVAETAPGSIETTGQPERISEELFALYKAGSHEVIRSAEDIRNGVLEKDVNQVISEIEAALEHHGYSDEEIFEFGQDVLVPLGQEIQSAYDIADDRKRGDTLWDLYDTLLIKTRDLLSEGIKVSTPVVIDSPLVIAEASPAIGPDLSTEPDQAVAVESPADIEPLGTSAGLVESGPAIPEALLERKDTMIKVLEADLLRLKSVHDRVIYEMSSVSEDNKLLVAFSLKLINRNMLVAETEYKSFTTVPADDLEIGKKFLTVSRSIQKRLTIVNEIVTRLHAGVFDSNGTASEILDINLDEEWIAENGLDIDLNKLNQEVQLAGNDVAPEPVSAVDLDLSDRPIKTDEPSNNFREATGIFASDPEMYPPDINTQLLPGIQSYYREFKTLTNNGLEPHLVAEIKAIFFGDNSIESLLRQARTNFEERKSTSDLFDQIQSKMLGLDALIQTYLYRLDLGATGPNLDVVAEEDDLDGVTDEENLFSDIDNPQDEAAKLAALQLELADMKEQVGRLREYVVSQGAEASPEVLRVLEMIESAENAPESDQKVSSMNLDRRLRAIKKILNGEDKRSGPYFTVLSPEERLAMAGLPRTSAESGVRALEDGDSYTQALVAYRLARHDFMGGTRKVNPGEVTLDGSEYTKDDGLKTKYEQKLQEFYANPGRWNKVKNTFGLKPKLTPELEAMRSEYDTARVAYARTLQAVLAVRGTRAEGNKEFSAAGEKTKKAFGQKFVLDEFKQQQEIQAEALAGEKNETIQKILGVMRKHKWTMRGLTVLGAGVVAGGGLAALGIGAAALSGTAAVMGSATVAARMAAVIGLGGAFGKAAHVKFQKGVDAAQDDLNAAEKAVLADFSVDTMNLSQIIVERSAERVDSAKRTQKVATFAAAAAPGGVVGAAYVLDALTSTPLVESTLAKPFEVAQEVPDRPTMVVEKIDFTGKGLNKDAVPSGEWASLTKSAELKVADLLATRPHLTEVEVEKLVLEKIQTEFGNRPWWDSANVDAVDITISKRLFGAIPTPSSVEAEAVPAPAPVPSPEAEAAAVPPLPTPPEAVVAAPRYEVQTGDTLSKVTLEKFGGSEIMKGLTPAEQKAAIYELMERAQNKVALRDSIGLRGNDINKIYDGQAIKLDGLEAELKAIVADGDYKAPELPTRPNTGGLNVSTLDSGVNNIPINVAALPSDFGAEQSLPSPVLSERPVLAEAAPRGELVQAVYKVPEVPRPYAPSGNYLDTREYRAFVTEVFGSIEKFNRAVQAEVTQFERGTYDALDRLMGINVYLSPYKEFANLTMAEIDLKRAELESMKNQYDTFGGQNAPNPFGEVGQMKYETYRASVERLDQLKREYAWTPSTKLSDFIGRVVAETRAAELAEAKTLLQA